MLVAQNSVGLKDMGVASSSATLFRTIGGSFGVALFGTLYTNRLTDTLKGAGMGGSQSTSSMTPAMLKNMKPEQLSVIQHGIANGMHTVFLWGAVISLIAVVAALFLREVPLRGGAQAAEAKAEAALEGVA
ncbi:MFS transporter, partial [Kitasatospora sp. NPDC049285]